MKVLLIDDDEDLISIFTSALSRDSFEVVSATTGQEGLDKIKSEKPDIVLLDQVLPDISGNEILKSIKADSETKNIPVILLSNFSQEELVKGAIDEGAADYLFKYQVEPKDVVAKVKEALKI
jgi:DNA-binding response OmpR family regulator